MSEPARVIFIRITYMIRSSDFIMRISRRTGKKPKKARSRSEPFI